ncbi:ribbon-helix-helix protein, CopG family [Jannaschia pohangensis]|uniref:ribbon-helix-helix protein, CopG family n=1 Tax=Jannaschia pohangensis TaxID=390807 RepID=UPI000B87713E|nr:ribbon-helix-helix protein, CopG family [Jannaschia pohangensis]
MAKRGRAKASSITFMMSLPEEMADRLDAVGDRLEGRPSRQEVIRRMLDEHLSRWEGRVGIDAENAENGDQFG